MTPDDWRRAEEIFQQALDRPPEERASFLDREIADEPRLRRDVEALLAADARADSFLGVPILGEPPLDSVPEPVLPERIVPGGRVGPYRLLEEIGHGGWSRVYLAERDDEQFERRVAVKVIDPGSDSDAADAIAARFRVERQILADLDHPSIARLLDGGETADGRPYFVLEHVVGRSIASPRKRRSTSKLACAW